jgi:hypothetical protein
MHPNLAENARVAAFPLPEDDDLLDTEFDLILCIAVIMHLNDARLAQLASQMQRIVSSNGLVVLSHSFGHCGLCDDRDATGRLFRERPAEAVTEVFGKFGWDVTRQTESFDGLGREGICWTTQVLQKSA